MVTKSISNDEKDWEDLFKKSSKDRILKNFILNSVNFKRIGYIKSK